MASGIQTFDVDDTLFTLRVEWLYTLARLVKSAHTQAFVAEFQAVGPVLDAAIQKQGQLDDAAVMASAARDSADEALDPVIVQILTSILVITRNDRSDPLYVSYAGDQTVSEVIRPVLGPELAGAAEWVEPLKEEEDASLQNLAAPLESAVEIGKKAEKDIKVADSALSDFRLFGERKKAVDTLNAARGSLHGKLVAFLHAHPELRLPGGWPASFFRHATKVPRFGNNIEQVDAYLARLDRDRQDAEAFRRELQAKAEAQATLKANRAKAREELAALRKANKEAKAKEKALKAEAEKKLKR
ncbi:MAG: hypothetical protein QM820_20550 [Minicystis sp.]